MTGSKAPDSVMLPVSYPAGSATGVCISPNFLEMFQKISFKIYIFWKLHYKFIISYIFANTTYFISNFIQKSYNISQAFKIFS